MKTEYGENDLIALVNGYFSKNLRTSKNIEGTHYTPLPHSVVTGWDSLGVVMNFVLYPCLLNVYCPNSWWHIVSGVIGVRIRQHDQNISPAGYPEMKLCFQVNLAYENVKEVDGLDISKEGTDMWEAALKRYDERIDRVEVRTFSFCAFLLHLMFYV